MPAAIADPGEWGTRAHPLLMSPFGWGQLHPFLQRKMQHVHTFDGVTFECILNVFDDQCLPLTLPDWNQECAVHGCERPAVTRSPIYAATFTCGAHA